MYFSFQIFAQQLQDEGDLPKRQARRASDLCVSCKNSVFLAERLNVNGRLHHRVCFRCARCKSQLSLANYYETEQNQYCCETCPDEAAASGTDTLHSTPVQPTEVSSSSSAIVKSTLPSPLSESESISKDLPENATDKQQRRFLESMVSTPEVVVELTQNTQPVVENEKKGLDVQVSEVVVSPTEVPEVQSDSSGDVVAPVEENRQSEVPESSFVPENKVESVEQFLNPFNNDEAALSIEINVPEITEKDEDVKETEIRYSTATEKETDNVCSEERVEEAHTDKELEAVSELQNDVLKLPDTSLPKSQDATNDSAVSEIIVPKPRRRKSKRSTSPQKKIQGKSNDQYPEELNPFDDDSPTEATPADDSVQSVDDCSFNSGTLQVTPKRVLSAPKVSLNPFGSDDDEDDEGSSSNNSTVVTSSEKIPPSRPPPPVLKSPPHLTSLKASPSPKKRLAPAPPPPKPQRTPSLNSSGESTISRRKSAPPPPTTDLSKSPVPVASENESQSPIPKPRLLTASTPPLPPFPDASEKAHKNLSNLSLQCGVGKDAHGQWKRKKGPAPPRPSPQKRKLRKLPLKEIQQELEDIEVKQLELERQGVQLEQNIRNLTEPEDGTEGVQDGIHIEEMILHLFDLVNEKNELLRRQTELMYIRRQQRLEEEHAELEFQIRCLIEKPNSEKSDEDKLREEELIER